MAKKEYSAKEVTPAQMDCIAGVGCPAIYEAVDRTPPDLDCGIGACIGIYEGKQELREVYLIIGKQVSPSEVRLGDGSDLSHKVGTGEVLIEVPRVLIDDRQK